MIATSLPPAAADFVRSLRLQFGGSNALTLLRQKDSHAVYRLACPQGDFILKWFYAAAPAKELRVYALLAQLGVPTLPVVAAADQALLLADLTTSPDWRLAAPADMTAPETGQAVAAWYRALHAAGAAWLAAPISRSDWLTGWVDELSPAALHAAGARLGITAAPAWQYAVEQVTALIARYRACPQTFNYNDFAAENLALARTTPRRAVVFDYDCFATGVVYSDWRNVTYALHGAARSAFAEAYGEVDASERLLDDALAPLYGLLIASQRSRLPAWAQPLVAAVANGELEQALRRACLA